MKEFKKPIASVSLDLDDYWTYLKSNNDKQWKEYPSYLQWIVPRILSFFQDFDLKITFFLVGKDLENENNLKTIKLIVDAGHEIGNHSYSHDQWMVKFSKSKIEDEIVRSEDLIQEITGIRPKGYRGPGYSFSQEVAEILSEREYKYDCSTWPTFIGPISQLYFSLSSNFDQLPKEHRQGLFGSWKDCLRPIRAFNWKLNGLGLVEIPVSTFPFIRTPIHPTYLFVLSGYSRTLAFNYFKLGIDSLNQLRISPSIILHPTDFIGSDDHVDLNFLPNMKLTSIHKLELLKSVFHYLKSNFYVCPMIDHATYFTL